MTHVILSIHPNVSVITDDNTRIVQNPRAKSLKLGIDSK